MKRYHCDTCDGICKVGSIEEFGKGDHVYLLTIHCPVNWYSDISYSSASLDFHRGQIHSNSTAPTTRKDHR